MEPRRFWGESAERRIEAKVVAILEAAEEKISSPEDVDCPAVPVMVAVVKKRKRVKR